MTNVHCDYCGNTSGKEDSYGNCRSCGGKLTRDSRDEGRPYIPTAIWDRKYDGASGGFSTFGERGQEVFAPFVFSFMGVPVRDIKVGTEMWEEWREYVNHGISHGK